MYNEDYKMIVETLLGVYWNFYELIDMDAKWVDKVSVVIVADGIDWVDSGFLSKCQSAGIYRGDDN